MGHIYLIEDEVKRVKVGISIKPKERIQQISASLGIKAVRHYISNKIINYREIERILLKSFGNGWKKGEWINHDFDDALLFTKKVISVIGYGENKFEGEEYNTLDLIRHYCLLNDITLDEFTEEASKFYINFKWKIEK